VRVGWVRVGWAFEKGKVVQGTMSEEIVGGAIGYSFGSSHFVCRKEETGMKNRT
jgi:hypothetical protein